MQLHKVVLRLENAVLGLRPLASSSRSVSLYFCARFICFSFHEAFLYLLFLYKLSEEKMYQIDRVSRMCRYIALIFGDAELTSTLLLILNCAFRS